MAGSEVGRGNLAAELIIAMSDPNVMDMLSTAFAMKITQDLNLKIESVEKKVTEIEKRGDSFDERIDLFEQKELESNVVMSGVPSTKTNKEEIRKLLNENLQCNVETTDIKYTLKLGKKEEEKSSVRIVFNNKAKKEQVMKSKKKLKGQDMWLCDDLTDYRRHLAFHSCKAVKEGRATQTWVTDGKVFLKKTPSEKPQKITKLEDIPGLGAQKTD
jgi:hypothetical protein